MVEMKAHRGLSPSPLAHPYPARVPERSVQSRGLWGSLRLRPVLQSKCGSPGGPVVRSFVRSSFYRTTCPLMSEAWILYLIIRTLLNVFKSPGICVRYQYYASCWVAQMNTSKSVLFRGSPSEEETELCRQPRCCV